MKRILIFNDSLALGGTELLLIDLLSHLVDKGCAITLLLPQPSPEYILQDRIPSSVTVKYLYKANTSRIKKKVGESIMIFTPRLFTRFKAIKESDYDLVICFKESFYACIFSKMKIKKILWIHNILYRRKYTITSFKERIAVWLNKKQIKRSQNLYRKYDKVICVSDICKNVYTDIIYGEQCPKQDIVVLYNSIDFEKVILKSKEPIKNLPQAITKFILVARASPEKRIDRLIDATSRLKQEGYSFLTYIVGEGLDNEDMKTNLNLLNLTDTVYLLGRLDNPYPYILQSNWLLCVSERESFSLVLLEAMALKTPIITTDCGGPANIINNGEYGILVENSSDGVYNGMKAVLDDPTLSIKYSSHLDEALKRFDYNGWLKNVDQILDIEN